MRILEHGKITPGIWLVSWCTCWCLKSGHLSRSQLQQHEWDRKYEDMLRMVHTWEQKHIISTIWDHNYRSTTWIFLQSIYLKWREVHFSGAFYSWSKNLNMINCETTRACRKYRGKSYIVSLWSKEPNILYYFKKYSLRLVLQQTECFPSITLDWLINAILSDTQINSGYIA